MRCRSVSVQAPFFWVATCLRHHQSVVNATLHPPVTCGVGKINDINSVTARHLQAQPAKGILHQKSTPRPNRAEGQIPGASGLAISRFLGHSPPPPPAARREFAGARRNPRAARPAVRMHPRKRPPPALHQQQHAARTVLGTCWRSTATIVTFISGALSLRVGAAALSAVDRPKLPFYTRNQPEDVI